MRNEDSYSDTDEEIDRSWEIAETPGQEDLLPLLECPVCLNLPLPPIRTCYQGHTICTSCSQKVSRCPLCQKPIGIGRNFFAEDFLSKSVMKCKYAQDGCNLRLSGGNLKRHLYVCDFRPVKCTRCNTKVTLTNFDDHLLSTHAVGRWDLNDDGVRTILSEKRDTQRFDIQLPEAVSRPALYKALAAALALSFLLDQFFLDLV